MPAAALLFDEFAALDALRAFVRRAVPEVPAVDVYRAQPSSVPGKWGLSVVLAPVNPLPLLSSPMGDDSTVAQQQRVTMAVETAAPGLWRLRVLGEFADYTAGALDDAEAIRDGLSTALALLGLPVSVANTDALPGQSALSVLANVAGVSMTTDVTAPAGGAASVTMVDDCLRRTTYNWGIWTVRCIVRDIPQAGGVARSMAGVYCDRLRFTMQGGASIPISSTGTLRAFSLARIADRLARVSSGGRPRSMSLPPRLIITSCGGRAIESSTKSTRWSPPAVVSPDTPALVIRALIPPARSAASIRAG